MSANLTAVEKIRQALESRGAKFVRGTNNGFMATCPAHGDKYPSLSVTPSVEMALIYCFAGCSTPDVMAALGLALGDLYDNPKEKRYVYQAANGSTIKTKHRNPAATGDEKKITRQSGNTKAALLYRLPEVIRAVSAGEPVYLVEGEKDADTLTMLGVTATTTGSATSIPTTDLTPLNGAIVRAIADKDKSGDGWVKDARRCLGSIVSSLEFRQAAIGKDFSDHYAAGGNLDNLVAYVEPEATSDGSEPGLTLVRMSDVTPQFVTWLWPGRIPAGKLTMIDGDPSTGKSTLCLDLAARVSTGSPWPDGEPGNAPGGVFILSAEDGLDDTLAPRLMAAGADSSRIHAVTEVELRDDDGNPVKALPSLPRDIPLLERGIKAHGVALVVIDVFTAYLGGSVDAHKDQDIRGAMFPLKELAERTGAAILLIRHLNKDSGGNALYRGGGSIAITGAARAAYLIARDPDNPERRIMAVEKLNVAKEPLPLAYTLASDPAYGVARVEWEPEPLEASITASSLLKTPGGSDDDDLTEWLKDYVEDEPSPLTTELHKDAAKAAGWSTKQVRNRMKKLGYEPSNKGDFQNRWRYVPIVSHTSPPTGKGNYGNNGAIRETMEPEVTSDGSEPDSLICPAGNPYNAPITVGCAAEFDCQRKHALAA